MVDLVDADKLINLICFKTCKSLTLLAFRPSATQSVHPYIFELYAFIVNNILKTIFTGFKYKIPLRVLYYCFWNSDLIYYFSIVIDLVESFIQQSGMVSQCTLLRIRAGIFLKPGMYWLYAKIILKNQYARATDF